MKNVIKVFTMSALVCLLSCEEADQFKPVPSTVPSNYSAKFLFVNASPDAPELDMFVNNVKQGTSLESGERHTMYNTVPISNNVVVTAAAVANTSISSGLSANTNIRTKATGGTIGGTLGTSDLIFRAGNNNANNFLAVNGASYSVFVVDTVGRPKPYRTLRYDKKADAYFGDVTYYSTKGTFTAKKFTAPAEDTTIYLNVEVFHDEDFTVPSAAFASNNSIDAFNLVKKYYNQTTAGNPPFMILIGTVPLGASDPGGVRYVVVADEWPVPSTLRFPTPAASRFAARFINLSPDAGTVTASINGTAVAAANGIFSYPLTQGNFNPSVGSRSTSGTAPLTVTFANNFGALAPGNYNITTNAAAAALPYDFVDGGIYTVILTGSSAKNTLALSVIKHN